MTIVVSLVIGSVLLGVGVLTILPVFFCLCPFQTLVESFILVANRRATIDFKFTVATVISFILGYFLGRFGFFSIAALQTAIVIQVYYSYVIIHDQPSLAAAIPIPVFPPLLHNKHFQLTYSSFLL